MLLISKSCIAGATVFQSRAPTPEQEKHIAAWARADPDLMPYFLLNHWEYVELKEKVAMQVCGQDHKAVLDGLATIWVGVEALKVAEKLTQDLKGMLVNQSEDSKGNILCVELDLDCEKENGYAQC